MCQSSASLSFENRRAETVRRQGSKFLKEIRERFFHALRIFDFYSRNFQSQNRKTHRHAMVIVSLDFGAVQLGGINGECIAFFDDLRTAFGQFRPEGNDALALLDAETAELGKANRPVALGSVRRESN